MEDDSDLSLVSMFIDFIKVFKFNQDINRIVHRIRDLVSRPCNLLLSFSFKGFSTEPWLQPLNHGSEQKDETIESDTETTQKAGQARIHGSRATYIIQKKAKKNTHTRTGGLVHTVHLLSTFLIPGHARQAPMRSTWPGSYLIRPLHLKKFV